MKVWQVGAIYGLAVAYLATAVVPCAPAIPQRFSVRSVAQTAPAPAPAELEAAAPECHDEMANDSETETLAREHESLHGPGPHGHPAAVLASVEPSQEQERAPVGVRSRCTCGCDQPSGPTATSLAWHAPSMAQPSWPAAREARPAPSSASFSSRTVETPSPVPLQS